jgi:hypothetical protein
MSDDDTHAYDSTDGDSDECSGVSDEGGIKTTLELGALRKLRERLLSQITQITDQVAGPFTSAINPKDIVSLIMGYHCDPPSAYLVNCAEYLEEGEDEHEDNYKGKEAEEYGIIKALAYHLVWSGDTNEPSEVYPYDGALPFGVRSKRKTYRDHLEMKSARETFVLSRSMISKQERDRNGIFFIEEDALLFYLGLVFCQDPKMRKHGPNKVKREMEASVTRMTPILDSLSPEIRGAIYESNNGNEPIAEPPYYHSYHPMMGPAKKKLKIG